MARARTSAGERLRSLGFFFVAILYFIIAQLMAGLIARFSASGDLRELFFRVLLLLILLGGYAGMGYVFQLQPHPVKAMGLVRREGWSARGRADCAWLGRNSGLRAADCSCRGLVVTLWTTSRQMGLLLLNLLVLAAAAMAEEIAFRGYPFQRLIEATGPTTATIVMATIFGLIHLRNPGATSASTLVTVLSGGPWRRPTWQTAGALWLPWGFHFGWNAAMAVLFGLPVSGLDFSAVVSSNSVGPTWLTWWWIRAGR